MSIVVNGQAREVAEGATVTQLLEQLKIEPARVVVELNLTILKRAEHPTTVLKEGDRVEVVHFVGGGSEFCCKLPAAGYRLLPEAWGL
ncbi:MAG: sulfur carrier protein ThiS [Candidatus Omnitrophica bacterium]|nr:sulfur carrier protein ThiS [Candidatus Omnitrophota bacterium]